MSRQFPGDEPLDFDVVSADDALVERLRNPLGRPLSSDDMVLRGDSDSDDPSYALLRALQYDVSAGLPTGPVLPTEVVLLRAGGRSFGRTATVAAIAVGVMSLAGVAAAATSQPVRSAVVDAVSSVVAAITPDAPVRSTGAARSVSDTPTATITPRGKLVRDASRSTEAARFIGAALARADRLTKAGQYSAAANQLDTAERRLPLVTPADGHDALQTLLAVRRAELAAARTSVPAKPTHRPAAKHTSKPTAKPHPTKAPAPPRKEHRPAATGPTTQTHSVPVHAPNVHSTPSAVRRTKPR